MSFATDFATMIANQTAILTEIQGLPSQVQAAFAGASSVNFYVDPINGSDAALGTVAAPFQTLAKAISLCVQGRRSVIYLVAQTGNTVQLTYAGSGNGVNGYELGGYDITFASADPTQTPTLSFQDEYINVNENVSARFTGYGNVVFSGLNVAYPQLPNAQALSSNNGGGFFCDAGAIMSVAHFGGSISFGSIAPFQTSFGFLSLALNEVTINCSAGDTLLEIASPTLFEATSVVLPSGVTLASLINNESAGTEADGTPRGLLTNIVF